MARRPAPRVRGAPNGKPSDAVHWAAARAAVIAIALAFWIPGPAIAQEKANPQLAKLYFHEAKALAEIGDWPEAGRLVDEALLLDGSDPDLRYLEALCIIKRGSSLNAALASADAALASGGFAEYSGGDARLLKAELLVRLRRWDEALSTVDPPEPGFAVESAYRWIRSRAFAGSGRWASFYDELELALARFPDDPRFARLFLERGYSPIPSGKARALGDIIVSRLPGYSLSDPGIGILALPLMPDLEARRKAVLASRSAGGSGSASILAALEYGIIDEKTAMSEILVDGDWLRAADIETLQALCRTDASREALAERLASWAGELGFDRDRDGIHEERISMASGSPREWMLDEDQDGLGEVSARLSADGPESVEIRRSEFQVEIVYGRFPYCERVSFLSGGLRRSYSFAPEALAFEPLRMKAFPSGTTGSLLLPEPTGGEALTERACLGAALAVVTSREGRAEVETLTVYRGVPLVKETRIEGRLVSELSYKDGRPLRERLDSDGDGRFETERVFVADAGGGSAASWVRIDTDGDLIFDYREESAFPFTKEWDLDGNGSVDARQYSLRDGSTLREFSSRLDGRFDEAITLRDGAVVEVRRDGRGLSIVPDANHPLSWIGEKPFDLDRNFRLAEGVFKQMNLLFRVFRIEGRYFAELAR
jgi:tetratricopeptide (TPR) repeat protein